MNSLKPDWLARPAVQGLIARCAETGIDIRFVGGCVRDTLMGRAVHDMDVATSALPRRVMEAFAAPPYKAIPTGIAHGTVTVVVDGQPFELTTLRRDVVCDGRHATVQFSDNWEEDALRRDFTFNALMLSPDGTLYDAVGGLADAISGHVRFIGDAAARIAEDYLRILRFFRFYATHGRIPLDEKALHACRQNAEHLRRLSVERVAGEMQKLLLAANPLPALRLMQEWGVLNILSAAPPNLNGLAQLLQEEKPAPFPLRLVVLYGETAPPLAAAWKLPVKMQNEMRTLLAIPPLATEREVRHAIYAYSRELVRAALLRDVAMGAERKANLFTLTEHYTPPVFPITGAMLMERGLQSGKELGNTLRRLHQVWQDSDFTMSEEVLLSFIQVKNK
jgi:poly(A) polymerase